MHFDDPVEAVEVVQVADLLPRLLRRAERGLPAPAKPATDRTRGCPAA
jgi:hypothetical protein